MMLIFTYLRTLVKYMLADVLFLMSRTGMAVEKWKFAKIPYRRRYLLKTTRAERKKDCQNHWKWLNKPFRNASKPWEWFTSKEIGFRTSWSPEMLNSVSLLVMLLQRQGWKMILKFETSQTQTGDELWDELLGGIFFYETEIYP